MFADHNLRCDKNEGKLIVKNKKKNRGNKVLLIASSFFVALNTCTVELLLSDQLRDRQKVVAEEKWSLNAKKCTILE